MLELYLTWDDMPFPAHSICFGNSLTFLQQPLGGVAFQADVKTEAHIL